MAIQLNPKDIINRLPQLSEREVCEMYAKVLPRAMDTNPLREWVMKMNPTREDLAECLRVLPPKDMTELEDIFFS